MQRDARNWVKEAIDSQEVTEEKEISAYVKVGGLLETIATSERFDLSFPCIIDNSRSQRKFDHKYGPTWHCIVGADFKAAISHESKHYIMITVGKQNVLLYKAG